MSDKILLSAKVRAKNGQEREVVLEEREKDSEVVPAEGWEGLFDYSCFYYGYGTRISPVKKEYVP